MWWFLPSVFGGRFAPGVTPELESGKWMWAELALRVSDGAMVMIWWMTQVGTTGADCNKKSPGWGFLRLVLRLLATGNRFAFGELGARRGFQLICNLAIHSLL